MATGTLQGELALDEALEPTARRALEEEHDPDREEMVCRLPEPGYTQDEWAERWFPLRNRVGAQTPRSPYTEETAWAVNQCTRCPFVVACGAWALKLEADAARDNRFGVYGAMDPIDRWVKAKNPKKHRSYRTPVADAEPLRELLTAEKEASPSGASVDVRVAQAVGVSPDTIRMIRTGNREQVKQSTYEAVMGYFGVEVEK